MSTPVYAPDLFADDGIAEPYGHYRALRDLGPVVWLEATQVHAVARHADVCAVLADPGTFVSGSGVGLNHIVNSLAAGTTLMSDGAGHERQRKVLSQRLSPRALRPLGPSVRSTADELVRDLVRRGSFDAVADLARAMPMAIVPDLVGWPVESRGHLLSWAAAAFDILGPLNARAGEAGPRVQAMSEFAARVVAERSVLPGSAAADMLGGVDRGELELATASSLVIDYLAPSMDTTISALGSAVWLLGTHPEQWQALREDPSLVAGAVEEVVRLESPIRCFSRLTATDTEIGGVPLPAGARVLLLFASANRDERQWDRPDEFDVTRDASAHVGFGAGLHGCAGQGLARLEVTAVLQALLAQVETLTVARPVRGLNNLIRALARLDTTVTPARGRHVVELPDPAEQARPAGVAPAPAGSTVP